MPVSAPSIDFVKAACSSWGTSIGIGAIASTVAKAATGAGTWNISSTPTMGGTPTWVNKAADVTNETAAWASVPVVSPVITSGIGFVPSGATTDPSLLQGSISDPVNILIVNNYANVTPNPGTGTGYAVAENCKLQVFDSVSSTAQTTEPVSRIVSSAHYFWLQVKQLGYWYFTPGSPGSWSADTNKANPGPYCLGGNDSDTSGINERYPGGTSSYAPLAAAAALPYSGLGAGTVTGVGYMPVGSQTNSYIGCANVPGGSIAASNYGGAIELQMRLLVPEDATAMFQQFALAVRYTFVVA